MRRMLSWVLSATVLVGPAGCTLQSDGESATTRDVTESLALIRALRLPEPPAARVIATARTPKVGTRVAYASRASAVALRAGFEAGQASGGYQVTEVTARPGGGFAIRFTLGARTGTVVIGTSVNASVSAPDVEAGADVNFCVIDLVADQGDNALIEATIEEQGDDPSDYEEDFSDDYFEADLFAEVQTEELFEADFFASLYTEDLLAGDFFDEEFFAEIEWDEGDFFVGLEGDGFDVEGYLDDPLFDDPFYEDELGFIDDEFGEIENDVDEYEDDLDEYEDDFDGFEDDEFEDDEFEDEFEDDFDEEEPTYETKP